MKNYLHIFLIALGMMFWQQSFSQCNEWAEIFLVQQSGTSVTVSTNFDTSTISPIFYWTDGQGNSIEGSATETFTYPFQQSVYIIELFIYDLADTTWCAYGNFTIQAGVNCNVNSVFNPQVQDNGIVIFNATSTGGVGPYTYLWSFSDGQVASGPVVTMQFSNGFHEACLLTQDAQGCIDSSCVNFAVTNGPCNTNFLDLDVQVDGNVVTGMVFLNNPILLPVNLSITYGDNTVETNLPPLTSVMTFQHSYPLTGESYEICVIGANQAGCLDTVCATIATDPCGLINPVFTHTLLQDGVTFFTASSNTQGGAAYLWDFGDGQTGFGQITEHLFDSSAVYNVCLTVVDSANGCSESFCMPITAQSPCQSLFNNPSIQVNNLSATVQNFTSGGCGSYTYTWSVPGLALNGTSANFNLQFPQAGTYDLIISVADNCGCSFTQVYSLVASCSGSGGQATNYNMQNGSITTCNLNFSDPGGPNGNYANNQSMILTVYPATSGAKLQVQFSQFVTETNFDYLYIHNGNTDNAPLLATLNGTLSTGNLIYTSTAADGSLTFVWDSDISVTAAGWQANITCNDLSISSVELENGLMQFTAESALDWETYAWTINGVAYGNNSDVIEGVFTPGEYLEVCVTGSNAAGCSSNACDFFQAPCNYNVAFSTNVIGNQVTVIITNPQPDYYYGGMSGWGQNWVEFDENNTGVFTLVQPQDAFICIYAEGSGCFDSTCVNVDISSLPTSTLGGYVWADLNGNGLLDDNEEGIPNTYVLLCAGADSVNCISAITDENGFYSFEVFAGTYNLQAFPWLQNFVATLPSGGNGYNFSIGEGEEILGFDFGFQDQSVYINGIVFYDTNNNGIQDSGEQAAAYKQVMIGNFAVYTNNQGQYSISVPAGVYNITLNMNVLAGYTISVPAGGSYNVNASAVGLTYGGNNFGLWADPSYQDLSAYISPISTITPGFPFMASLGYCNNGLNTSSGSFTYYWDPAMGISEASEFSPAPSVFSASENSATWNFSNLQPGACNYIYMHPDMPVSLELGANMFQTVMVSPLNDSNPANNIDTLHMVVVGSWDPNDKQGTPAGVGEDGKIFPNTQLSYTIRFQNTGTAPAVNVVLIDTLTNELVLETFNMISSSHNYTVQVDNENRVIRWTFSNIMLPDSTSDPLGSIGYVRFSMNPAQDQPDGTVINNFADIYFDFNEPIRTNTTVHTIDRFLAVNNVNSDNKMQVFPNPFKGNTRFVFGDHYQGEIQLEVTDMLGRTIDSFRLSNASYFDYQAEHLSSGMYMYRITGKNLDYTGKLIVK